LSTNNKGSSCIQWEFSPIIYQKNMVLYDDIKTRTMKWTTNHYFIWQSTYFYYLKELYNRIIIILSPFLKGKTLKIKDFIRFAYEFSSGYITPYA
jgi:hypothetical protein